MCGIVRESTGKDQMLWLAAVGRARVQAHLANVEAAICVTHVLHMISYLEADRLSIQQR